MKSIQKRLVILILIIITLLCVGISVYASDDVFTYDDYGDYYVITGYNGELSGNIVIPSTHNGLPVYEIGEYAFDGCTGITGITVEDGIEVIWDGAFANCTSLESVVIPDSVLSMEQGVFYNCPIKKLTTPFTGCDREMSGDYGCISYMFSDPVYASSSDSISIPVKELILTDETMIHNMEFYDCESLESIELNEGITYIGRNAFESCTSLKEIEFPDSVTEIAVDSLYDTAYYKEKFNWKDGILYCGKHIVDAEQTIVNPVIKEDTLTIGSYSFLACEEIREVVIPDSVKNINFRAFSGCTGLSNIVLGSNVDVIGRNAFDNTYYYNDSSNWQDGLLYLGDWLINAQTDITKADIKDGTLYIADYAFSGSGVQSVTMPDSIIRLGISVFAECSMLENVKLSANIREIPTETFYNCESLTEISVPDSVVRIGDFAFDSCTNLKSVALSEKLEYIGSGVFAYSGIESIVIPDSVTYIGRNVFEECSNLKTVKLSNGITEMIRLFRYCTSLENVIIPEGVTDITQCFVSCTSLKSLTVPEGVTYLYRNFDGCTALEELVVYSKKFDYCRENVSGGNNVVVYGYKDSDAEWDISGYSEFISLDDDINIEKLSASINEDKIDVKVDFSQKYMAHKVLVGLYGSDNSLLGISSVEPCGDNSISFDNNVKASFVKVFVMKSPLSLIPITSESVNITK